MLANWIHISIVHLLVIGCPWMLYRMWVQRKEALITSVWKFNYTAIIVLGVVSAIAYFTGPKAADWTKEVLANYSQDLIEDHALWGRVAFVLQVIAALLGVMSWASIWQEEVPDGRIPKVLMVLMLINTLLLLYTAHLGGYIRRIDLF